MLLLDITIVNVALPDIQKDLGSSFSDLQWVVDAYALMLASLLLTAGSLGDILGRRLVFAGGLVLFTAASLTCALASSPLFLNLSRGAQGVGGAILLATSLALIAQAFQGRERGTAFGIWGATIGFAVAVGPLVGGALTEYLGWQWIFYINLPIGIFTLIVTLVRVPEAYQRFGASIDWPGVATWTASLFLLVFALIRGNDEGWSSPQILGLFAGWAVLLVAFVLIERAQEYPMLELRLFRIPTFTGGAIVAFTIAASMFAMFLYLTLYLQNVLGISPLGTGLRFLPLSMISFFVAAAAGPLSERFPVRLFLGGGLVVTGIALVLMQGLSDASRWTALLPGVDATQIAHAVASGSAKQAIAAAPPAARVAIAHAARDAFVSGLNQILVVAAIVAFVGAVAGFALVRRRDFVQHASPVAARAE
jgi:EmrB/QacA subfamily drug resistance transporter